MTAEYQLFEWRRRGGLELKGITYWVTITHFPFSLSPKFNHCPQKYFLHVFTLYYFVITDTEGTMKSFHNTQVTFI